MVGRGVARKIASIAPPRPEAGLPRKSVPPLESPESMFRRVIEAYMEKGMGPREALSRLFGPGNEEAARRAAERLESFTDPDLRDSFAISFIAMQEYTGNPEHVLKALDFCASLSRDSRNDVQEACTAAHLARIALNIGEQPGHNPSDTLGLLFDLSANQYLRENMVRALMCLSRISMAVYEPEAFNRVVNALRMLCEVSPSSVPRFLSSMVIFSNSGQKRTVDDACCALIAIWTLRKGYVSFMVELMDAINKADADAVSEIADDLRARICTVEPVE